MPSEGFLPSDGILLQMIGCGGQIRRYLQAVCRIFASGNENGEGKVSRSSAKMSVLCFSMIRGFQTEYSDAGYGFIPTSVLFE